MSTKKIQKFEINDDANFLRINGRVYSLNDVGKCKINDVIESSKKFFEVQANSYTDVVASDISSMLISEEQKELEHIRKAQTNNVCVIPSSDYRKLVVAYEAGKEGYGVIRPVVFNPRSFYFGVLGLNRLTSSMRDAFRYLDGSGYPAVCGVVGNSTVYPERLFSNTPYDVQWNALINGIRETQGTYLVTVEQFIPPQTLLLYKYYGSIVFYPLNSNIPVHPHCMSGGTLCTGNENASTYWDAPSFNIKIAQINYESLGTSYFQYVDNDGRFTSWDMCKDLNKMKLVSITREERTSWRTVQTS